MTLNVYSAHYKLSIKDTCETVLSTLKPVDLGNTWFDLVYGRTSLIRDSVGNATNVRLQGCRIEEVLLSNFTTLRFESYMFLSFYEETLLHMICHTWVQLLS